MVGMVGCRGCLGGALPYWDTLRVVHRLMFRQPGLARPCRRVGGGIARCRWNGGSGVHAQPPLQGTTGPAARPGLVSLKARTSCHGTVECAEKVLQLAVERLRVRRRGAGPPP